MPLPSWRRRFYLPVAGVLVASTAIAIIAASAMAQAPGQPGAPVGKTFSYAAKFVCGLVPSGQAPLDPTQAKPGFPPELALKPANYATDINVHNPQIRGMVLWKKAVLSGWVIPAAAGANVLSSEPEQPFEGGKYITVQLGPDGAFSIDCTDIVRKLLPPGQPLAASFVTGFVVINSPDQLDVTAVYTSERQDPPVVHCLMKDGHVLVATPDAANILQCPPDASGNIGVVSIAASQAGTGLSIDVESITPISVTFPRTGSTNPRD